VSQTTRKNLTIHYSSVKILFEIPLNHKSDNSDATLQKKSNSKRSFEFAFAIFHCKFATAQTNSQISGRAKTSVSHSAG
jgi:hypothetical protein